MAPEDNTTTTVHRTDKKSQEEAAVEIENESDSELYDKAKNEDDSEEKISDAADDIDLSESHMEL